MNAAQEGAVRIKLDFFGASVKCEAKYRAVFDSFQYVIENGCLFISNISCRVA